jgi:polysaccharide deacetylase 2 family uncharacterized protein YibQ
MLYHQGKKKKKKKNRKKGEKNEKEKKRRRITNVEKSLKRDRYVINHTGSSLSAAAAFPTTAHIIPVLRNKNRQYEIIKIDRRRYYR